MGRIATSERTHARAAAVVAYRKAVEVDPHFAPHAEVALEVLGELGRGGMGIVYRVRDRRLGREAALKVLTTAPDAEAVRRFRREGEVTARLDHPAIPPVYEAGTDARGRHYLLMRVIEGESMARRIAAHHEGRDDAPVSRELLEALVKVGEAVAYAHGRGVLHRDLKPANVMLGRFGEVVVMDWGLARRLDRDGDDDDALLARSGTNVSLAVLDALGRSAGDLTIQGTVLGTPGYMAPEQTLGGALDERADVFALGAILVEVLTGRPPVVGATPLERLSRTARGEISGVRARRPDLPAELHDLAAAALCVDPRGRTPRAEAFVTDLRAYLAGAEVSAHTYSWRERALRGAWRRPTRAVVGAAAALIVATLGLTASALGARADQVATAQRDASAAGGQRDDVVVVGAAVTATTPAPPAIALTIEPPAAAALAARRERVRRVATATDHDRTGLERRRAGDLAGAVAAHTRAIELDRALTSAHVNRGAARQELGEVEAAIADYDRALELDPTCAKAFANRAVARLAQGDLRRAITDADRAVALVPDDVVSLLNRGLLRQQLGDLEGAIADHRRVVELEPARADAWTHLARARHAAGDLTGAAADHDRAVSLALGDARLRVSRGVTRRELGDLQGARADADRAVELDPTLIAAWNLRALLHEDLGDHAAALRDFDRAVSLDPRNAPVLHNRGVVRHTAGDLGGAVADQTRALELAPTLADAWAARGHVREEQGDLTGALADFDQALALEPSAPAPLEARACVKAALGDRAGAARDLERLSELAPGDPEVLALRAELGL